MRRYDGETGSYLDTPVAPGAGGLSGPLFLCFARASSFTIHAPTPGIAGATNWLAVSGATPGAAVQLAAGRARLLSVLPGCPNRIGLPQTELLVPCVADESGRTLYRWQPAASLSGVRLFLRAAEPANCRASPFGTFRFP